MRTPTYTKRRAPLRTGRLLVEIFTHLSSPTARRLSLIIDAATILTVAPTRRPCANATRLCTRATTTTPSRKLWVRYHIHQEYLPTPETHEEHASRKPETKRRPETPTPSIPQEVFGALPTRRGSLGLPQSAIQILRLRLPRAITALLLLFLVLALEGALPAGEHTTPDQQHPRHPDRRLERDDSCGD